MFASILGGGRAILGAKDAREEGHGAARAARVGVAGRGRRGVDRKTGGVSEAQAGEGQRGIDGVR